MSNKVQFILATVAVAALSETAHACTGNACDSIVPDTPILRGGELIEFNYTLFNKDKDRRVGVIACIIWKDNSCIPRIQTNNTLRVMSTQDYRHSLVIDANNYSVRQSAVIPGNQRQPYLDIQSAVFLDPPKGNGQQQGSGQKTAQSNTVLPVDVRYRNAEKTKDMQVYIVDRIAKKTVENNRQITPGGTGTAKVIQDKDKYIDVMFSIVMKDDKGASTYRYICKRTSATGSVSFDLSWNASSGSAC